MMSIQYKEIAIKRAESEELTLIMCIHVLKRDMRCITKANCDPDIWAHLLKVPVLKLGDDIEANVKLINDLLTPAFYKEYKEIFDYVTGLVMRGYPSVLLKKFHYLHKLIAINIFHSVYAAKVGKNKRKYKTLLVTSFISRYITNNVDTIKEITEDVFGS